ncbi:hypothetical protein EDC56_0610 [Sinobacterium caligoides]|uniref:Uncharacterized protein n=1 Tax=Sinobacterium caligoides TaxID=933926 RepID=A0A3N2DYY6_9GAMM|nr:hypothetical protein [Sinobacterium caligoides]ROS05086.1 hypothetical protein EDC56_0610 [Sinobacterium caligoides]
MSMLNQLKTIASVVLLVTLVGCVSAPLQRYAKTGDVLTVPFASIKKDTNGEYIAAEDLTVTIDEAGAALPVKVLATKRVFGQSGHAMDLAAQTDSNLAAYDGQWLAVLQLVDPQTDQPLVLTPGATTLAISSAKLAVANGANRADLSALPIEILAGTATALPAALAAQLGYVDDANYALEIRPSSALTPARVGGLNLVLRYSTVDVDTALLSPLIPDPNVQLIADYSVDNDVTLVKAMVMNASGFVAGLDVSSRQALQAPASVSDLSNIALSFQYSSEQSDWQNLIIIDSDSSYYFDLNGEPIAGVVPVLQRVK